MLGPISQLLRTASVAPPFGRESLRQLAYRTAIAHAEYRLRSSERHPYDTIQRQRFARLAWMLRYAVAAVPLYRELFGEAGVGPDDLQSEADLQKLPRVEKQGFLRRPHTDILARGMPPFRIIAGITSGSTGEPFPHFLDRAASPLNKANLYRPWRWAGVDPADLTVHCSGPHARGNTPNTLFLHPHEIAVRKTDYIQKIREMKPRLMRGYPLTNFELAQTIRAEGAMDITFDFAFFVGHVIPRGIREFFAREFGCEVYGYYATQETGPLGAECERHAGYHIHEESFVIEVTDATGVPLPEGTRGEIVITSLVNEVMPLIRYRTGDFGAFAPGLCSCGRTARRLIVEGRQEDMLVRPDGQCLYPGIMRDVLDDYFSSFERYQVVQSGWRDIILRVVPAERFTESDLHRARAALQACVGPAMRVAAETVAAILPLANGKFRYFISEYWQRRFPRGTLSYDFGEEKALATSVASAREEIRDLTGRKRPGLLRGS